MRKLVFALLVSLGSLFFTTNGYSEIGHIDLPDLGDGGLISLQEEYILGQQWLREFRRQAKVMNDPLLQDYVEKLVNYISQHSELKDKRLSVVVLDYPAINAFAVPGGIVGINTGLLLNATEEAEVASVVAHELAHISQRHYIRAAEAQKLSTWTALAGLLAGILLASTGADAGLAAIYASQAMVLQSRVNYTRVQEQEADTIGLQTLYRSNYDVNAAEAFFQKILQQSRYADRVPEYLRTHPLTTRRIADLRGRASRYPKRDNKKSNLLFYLLREKIILSFKPNIVAARNDYDILLKEKPNNISLQYGLMLALLETGESQKASELGKTLLAKDANQPAFILAQARALEASNQLKAALALLNQKLLQLPNNFPISLTYSQMLSKSGQFTQARDILRELSYQRPNDPNIWNLLATAEKRAHNPVEAYIAKAEYLILLDQFSKAQEQLRYALTVSQDNAPATARINRILGLLDKALKNRRS